MRGTGRALTRVVLFTAMCFVFMFVLDWNERSRRVAEGHGFAVDSALESDEGRFLVMTRRGTGAPSF